MRNYATGDATGGHFKRGYIFEVTQTTVVTALSGAGTGGSTFAVGLYTATSTATLSGDLYAGGSTTPTALLGAIEFTGAEADSSVVTKALSSPITLEPGNLYLLAQMRLGTTGNGSHVTVTSLNHADILTHPRIKLWGPSGTQGVYYWGQATTAETFIDKTSTTDTNLPRLGLLFESSCALPEVTTDGVTIAGDQITFRGTLSSTGGTDAGCPDPAVELAFERGTQENVAVTGTFSNATPNSTTTPGSFSFTLSGLAPNQTYYFQAVAINEAGRVEGALLSFTYTPEPVVDTMAVSAVTAATATLSASLTSPGTSEVTSRGFCVTADGGTEDCETFLVSGPHETGTFTAPLTELEPLSAFTVRAFATNGSGTAFSGPTSFTTLAAVNWTSTATGPLILDEAFSLDLDTLTTAGGGGARSYALSGGTLPAGLTLSGSTITGTVTDDALIGDEFPISITVSEATSDTTATEALTLTVSTYGALRTTDYGTAPTSGGAFCWRGYYFRTSSDPTVVTGLIGGGTAASSDTKEFRGALYTVNTDGSGNPTTPSGIIADVRFSDATVNQLVRLPEPVELAPNTWYALMQGSVTGTVLHWYVQSLDAGDLVAASARIGEWLPGDAAPGRAFFGPCNAAPSELINRSLSSTSDKPAVGIEFLTTSKPPQVTTVDQVDGVMTGELDAGSPASVGYIQHGANLDSGSRLDLIGARTGGQTFGFPLSSVTDITSGTSYSFRARAINDAGATNGATVTIPTEGQALTGWAFPSGVSSGVTYGHGTIAIPGVSTSASGTSSPTPTVTSQTTSICTVSSSATGTSRDVTVTVVGAGTCSLRASHPGGWDASDAVLYRALQSNISLSVAPLPIGISGTFTVADRVYDDTTTATIASNALVPGPEVRIGGDVISLSGITLGFDAPDVGTRTASITAASLTGTHADRYALTIDGAPTAQGAITGVSLTVSAGTFTADDKVYDATAATTITGSGLTLTGFVSGDSTADITWTPVGRFTTSDAGSDITVELAGGAVLGGLKGANYTLDATGAPTATASITPRPITITGATAATRPYDGTTAVTVSGASLANTVAGDVVSLANATSGVAASRNAGTQGVSTSMTLSGADAANYRLAGQPSLSVTITPLPVSVTMNALPSRAYDGSSALLLSPGAFSVTGVLAGESIAVSGTGQLSSRAAGTRTVTVTPTFTPAGGTELVNYTLPTSVSGTVTVTPLPLRVVGAAVTSRVWDGSTAATISGATLEGVRAGDAVSLTAASDGTFTSAQPGTHTVRFTPTLVGVDAANYRLSGPALSGTITRAPASLRITGGLTQFADGTPRGVRAAVSPAGAGRIVITYGGGGAPTAPGSYPVRVTLDSPTHEASALSATLTVQAVEDLLDVLGPAADPDADPDADRGTVEERRAAVLARIAVHADGTRAYPEIGPVLAEDGTAPALIPNDRRVLSDGEPVESRVSVVEDERVRVESDGGFAIELTAAIGDVEDRLALPVDADGTLLLDRGGFVDVGGTGFRPGSTAEVWMFSTVTFLGTAIVDADGGFAGSFPIDDLLEAGDHTIQLNGVGADEQVRSTSLGVRVDDPENSARERIAFASERGEGAGITSGPVWLILLAALLGAATTRWWIVGRRRRDDEDVTADELVEVTRER